MGEFFIFLFLPNLCGLVAGELGLPVWGFSYHNGAILPSLFNSYGMVFLGCSCFATLYNTVSSPIVSMLFQKRIRFYEDHVARASPRGSNHST